MRDGISNEAIDFMRFFLFDVSSLVTQTVEFDVFGVLFNFKIVDFKQF